MPRSRCRGATAMPRAGSDTTLPAMLIAPSVGCSRPATQRNVVVLPQPEGPSSTTISPAGTAKLTPSTAGRPIANCLRKPRTSRVADIQAAPFTASPAATNAAVILRCSPLFRASLEGWPQAALLAAILRDAAQERGSSG